MPICHRIDNEYFALGLWDLIESETQLTKDFVSLAPDGEISRVENFTNSKRKAEWMATRLLLYQLINQSVEIKYDANGKPFLKDFLWDISISHTKGLVAIILAKKNAGIDVEALNDRVLKIEDKFLCDEEKSGMPSENRLKSVMLTWSAKETLYKIFGEKGLDFKKQIFVERVEPKMDGEFKGEIKFKNVNHSFNLNYFIYKPKDTNIEYIVVYHYA